MLRKFVNSQAGDIVLVECNEDGSPLAEIPDFLFPLPLTKIPAPNDNGFIYDYIFDDSAKRLATVEMKKLRKIGSCYHCDNDMFEGQQAHRYAQNRGVLNSKILDLICSKCIKHFIPCQNCGYNYKKEDLNNNTCPVCIQQSNKIFVKNYTFKVEQIHEARGKSLDQIYYGTELELECLGDGDDILVLHNLTKDFCVLKKDASLCAGIEVVSTPCSIDEHYYIWDNFFKHLPDTIKPMRTCGMHVHATRNRISDLAIGKMLTFIHNPENNKFISLIAERPSSFHNDFETKKEIKFGRNGGRVEQNSERHTALNLNGDKTVEFRIFSSTIKRDNFLKNIEFCKSLIKFSDLAKNSIKDSQKHSVFCDYISENSKEYPFLYEFIENNISSL